MATKLETLNNYLVVTEGTNTPKYIPLKDIDFELNEENNDVINLIDRTKNGIVFTFNSADAIDSLNAPFADTAAVILFLTTSTGFSSGAGGSASTQAYTGFFNYNDSTTATTPIVVPGTNTFVDITNDGAGSFTNKLYPPPGVTDLWDSINQQFDWSQLSNGDVVDIRLTLDVITQQQNTAFSIELLNGIGGFQFRTGFITDKTVKTIATHRQDVYNSIYIDPALLTFPSKFQIKSDLPVTVKVLGWFVRVVKRGL